MKLCTICPTMLKNGIVLDATSAEQAPAIFPAINSDRDVADASTGEPNTGAAINVCVQSNIQVRAVATMADLANPVAVSLQKCVCLPASALQHTAAVVVAATIMLALHICANACCR